MTKRVLITVLAVFMAFAAPHNLYASGGEGEEFSPKEMVMEHLADSYEWHITTIKGRDIVVPLPVIVRSSTGWHVFSSEKICHGGTYEGMYIAKEGKYKDKIVEDVGGVQKRPIDISLTKTACGAILSLLVVMITNASGSICLIFLRSLAASIRLQTVWIIVFSSLVYSPVTALTVTP